MNISSPPLPPGVTQQQSPMMQYAAQQSEQPPQGGAPGGGGAAQVNSMQLVESNLTQVAEKLQQIAQILVQEKPELVVMMKPAVNALAMLQNEIKKGGGQPQGGPPQGMPPQGPPGTNPGAQQMATGEPTGPAAALSA